MFEEQPGYTGSFKNVLWLARWLSQTEFLIAPYKYVSPFITECCRVCEGLQLSASEFIVSGFCKKQTEIIKTPEQAENI